MYVRVEQAARSLVPEAAILWDYGAFLLVRGPVPQVPPDLVEDLNDVRVWVNGAPVAIPAGQLIDHDQPRTVVRFAGPIATAWIEALKRHGVLIHAWCPPHGALIELPAGMRPRALPRLAPVVGAVPYGAEDCGRPLPPPSPDAAALAEGLIDIVCFRRADLPAVEHALVALGAAVLARSSTKLRIRTEGSLDRIRDVAGVKLADRTRLPSVAGAPLAIAIGASGADGGWPSHLDGRGEIVAVADTGLDLGQAASCVDLIGRVLALESWPVNQSWGDWVVAPNADDGGADRNTGHGTYIATLIAGDDVGGGRRRGLAPAAKVVFQALEQWVEVAASLRSQLASGWYLAGRPLDLREVFRRSAAAGAFLHVNAWGDPARGAYTDDAWEVDAFLHENPAHLLLFAAGNEGEDLDGDGTPDPGSLCAPATAKNALSIGATEGPTAGVGHRGTWAQLDPAGHRWRNPMDRANLLSGRPDRIAPMSSAGPTADGRIKPELCAPGTNLAAARSRASASTGWAVADPARAYLYLGGTSVASAVAGGAATLLRQAWREHLGTAPGGPALKALLLVGAGPVWCRNGDTLEAQHVAGFGRIDLGACLPTGADAAVSFREHPGLATGERFALRLAVPIGGRLRVALCWYDPPGERLVNDLDLRVRGADDAVIAGQVPDRVNPSERLSLDVPAGSLTVEVTAANVPGGKQSFALAWAAPTGTRPQPALAVPVAALRGVGPRTSERLAAAGYAHIGALLPLDTAALARASGLPPSKAAALRAALEALSIPASSLSGDGTLAQAIARGVPAAIAIAPRFDRAWLAKITIASIG